MEESIRQVIEIRGRVEHKKASERYVSVVFRYETGIWEGWIPTQYRRTGVDLLEDTVEEKTYLHDVYEQLRPENQAEWDRTQEAFWDERPGASVTKAFFDVLLSGAWCCRQCELPANPNWARRIQDIKEMGYTLSTDTKRWCATCERQKTHILLVKIRRFTSNNSGYESISPALRKRIINVLGNIEVYENKPGRSVLPDHKFSEIRWGQDTKSVNPADMSDEEIRSKFQLLTNQYNQQKREVCRTCFQTGIRQPIYGIEWFYHGDRYWDSTIPATGKAAEQGCIGCPWYDIQAWRQALQTVLDQTT